MKLPYFCHACGSDDLEPIERSRQFPAVSSDIRLVSDQPRLALCPHCGVLQKVVDQAWGGAMAHVYSEYRINHQSGGADPVIFNSLYGPGARADILVAHLDRIVALPIQGNMLDIGCASGNILRSFGCAHPSWSLYGTEMSDLWRESVSAIPGVRNFCTRLEDLGELQMDLIIMSHVLEHIPDPAGYLARLRRHLRPGGILFVAVPDIRQNPIDLFVLDHCTHFDESTLGGMLTRGGFDALHIQSDVLGKEITAVCRCEARRESAAPATMPYVLLMRAVTEKYLDLCDDLMQRAQQLRREHVSFGVMGTSTAAAWLAGGLNLEVDFFVDEDPQRVGKSMFGKPTFTLVQVPTGACVFIPMSMETARAIIARAKRNDVTFGYLPWNQIGEASARVSAICESIAHHFQSAK